jgi:hypothetical protein
VLDLPIVSTYTGPAMLVIRGADATSKSLVPETLVTFEGQSVASRALPDGGRAFTFSLRKGLNRGLIGRRPPMATNGKAAGPVAFDQALLLTDLRLALQGDWMERGAIDSPNGIDTVANQPVLWLGPKPAEVGLLAGRAGDLEVRFDAVPGPSVNGSPIRRLRVSTDEGFESRHVVGAEPVVLRIPVSWGAHVLRLVALDAPTTVIPQDPRPRLVGVAHLQMRLVH